MPKLKHWQGYGSVDAKCLADFPYGYQRRKAVVQVQGRHEYGIVQTNEYDVWKWLCKRFVKACADWRDITDVKITEDYATGPDGGTVDLAVYEITYRKR